MSTTIYYAKDAREAANNFYGPLSQIIDHIKIKSSEGLYTINCSGVELTSKQIEILSGWGYKVETSVGTDDKVIYIIDWSE